MMRYWWKMFKFEMFALGVFAFVGLILNAFDNNKVEDPA